MTQDKFTTKIVKKYLVKTGNLITKATTDEFGDVTVRVVSVCVSDKWNYHYQQHARLINVEVTMKKSGYRFSEDRIPTKCGWNTSSRMRFFKYRKYRAEILANNIFRNMNMELFFKMASIPHELHSDFIGKITYKYID